MANNVNNSSDNNSDLSTVGSSNSSSCYPSGIQEVAASALNNLPQQGIEAPSLTGRVTKDPHYTWLDAISYFCYWLSSGRKPISFEQACEINNPAVVRGVIYYQKASINNDRAGKMINKAYQDKNFEVIYAIVAAGYPLPRYYSETEKASILHKAMKDAYDSTTKLPNQKYIEFITTIAEIIDTDLSDVKDSFNRDFFMYGLHQLRRERVVDENSLCAVFANFVNAFNKTNSGLFSQLFIDFVCCDFIFKPELFEFSGFFNYLSLLQKKYFLQKTVAQRDENALRWAEALIKTCTPKDLKEIIPNRQLKLLILGFLQSGKLEAASALLNQCKNAEEALSEVAELLLSKLKNEEEILFLLECIIRLGFKNKNECNKPSLLSQAVVLRLTQPVLKKIYAITPQQDQKEVLAQALTVAATYGNNLCLDSLVDLGGSIEQRDNEGNTLLHLMASGSFDHGISANKEFRDYYTRGSISDLKKFAEVQNEQGKTPIQIALEALNAEQLKVDRDVQKIERLEVFIRYFEPAKSIEDIIGAGDKDALIRKMNDVESGFQNILIGNLRVYLDLALELGKDELFLEILHFFVEVKKDKQMAFYACRLQDKDGNNLLHKACLKNNGPLINAIMSCQIDKSSLAPLKDQINKNGKTPQDLIPSQIKKDGNDFFSTVKNFFHK